MTFWVSPSAYKVIQTQHIRMLGQHHIFDVDLLGYFLDVELKHCSERNYEVSAVSQGCQNQPNLRCTQSNSKIFIF